MEDGQEELWIRLTAMPVSQKNKKKKLNYKTDLRYKPKKQKGFLNQL